MCPRVYECKCVSACLFLSKQGKMMINDCLHAGWWGGENLSLSPVCFWVQLSYFLRKLREPEQCLKNNSHQHAATTLRLPLAGHTKCPQSGWRIWMAACLCGVILSQCISNIRFSSGTLKTDVLQFIPGSVFLTVDQSIKGNVQRGIVLSVWVCVCEWVKQSVC